MSLFAFNSAMLNEPVPLWFQANFARQKAREAEDKYFASFGRFIAAYALAEASFHIAARHYSGLEEHRARAIFSGMRLPDLIERTRSLIADADQLISYDRIKDQFNYIGDERDQFVHRQITVDIDGHLKVTNLLTCKKITSAAPRHFSLDDMANMTLDCHAIFAQMVTLCGRLEHFEHVAAETSLLSAHASWRYKRPQPSDPTKRTPSTRKEPQRQRRASSELQQYPEK